MRTRLEEEEDAEYIDGVYETAGGDTTPPGYMSTTVGGELGPPGDENLVGGVPMPPGVLCHAVPRVIFVAPTQCWLRRSGTQKE